MVLIKELSNGVKVALEEITYVRSISLGIWVRNGSVNESKELNGMSHFIEHMMFKGTKNRTAKEIAEEMDSIGGQINAYTTKEYTCYHTRMLDKHFKIGLDVLGDMFLNSLFDEEEIKKERNVILEEIDMYEDSPEELVHELLQAEIWQEDSIGMPILGTAESIGTFNHKIMMDYFENNYRTDNTVISIAGNFDAEKIMEELESVFGKWTTKKNPNTSLAVPKYVPTKFTKNKDTEQIHLCLAFPSIERDHPEKYAYTVFNTIFGGGMSSVLFQKIREEHGLTYSIYSYLSQYNKTGVFVIYLGMNPKQTDTVFQLIFEEIRTLMENGVSADLVEKTKQQIISNFIIGTESTVNRMTSNGGSMLLRGKIITQEETIEKIEAVTTDDIKRIINKIFDFERISVAGVGKSEGVDFNSILENIISY